MRVKGYFGLKKRCFAAQLGRGAAGHGNHPCEFIFGNALLPIKKASRGNPEGFLLIPMLPDGLHAHTWVAATAGHTSGHTACALFFGLIRYHALGCEHERGDARCVLQGKPGHLGGVDNPC